MPFVIGITLTVAAALLASRTTVPLVLAFKRSRVIARGNIGYLAVRARS